MVVDQQTSFVSDDPEKGSTPRDEMYKSSDCEDIISVVDSLAGDEALKLVGKERKVQFSEDYNRKLRRKLVSNFYRHYEDMYVTWYQDLLILPLCAAVYFTQFL